MKRIRKHFAASMLALSLSLFAACGQSTQTQDLETDPAAQCTVTFMNGEEVLGSAVATMGELLPAADYEAYENQEGMEFVGWFETPSFLESSQKDLSVDAITKDTTLYGSFRNTNVAEDTRVWYLAGTSSGGPLAASNWGNESVAEADREAVRLQPTGNQVNEFSLTIDLYNGDQFQVIHDWAWDGQKGFGRFTQIDETQMESGGGLDGESSKANVNVIMDGNYTITLTTDPDNEALDTLSIVRNGDPTQAQSELETTVYTPSESTGVMVKGSWSADWSDLKELTRTEGNMFSITMDLEADTELCFMIYDNGEDTGLILKDSNVTDQDSRALMAENGNNIQVAKDGSYTFVVDADNMTVTITQ